MMSLKGRCAVVTGGASGIGRAVAVMMKQHGANVVVGDVNQPLKEDGFEYVKCDVTKLEHMQGLLDHAKSRFGAVSVWVNNAGIEVESSNKPLVIDPLSPEIVEALSRIVNINLLSVIVGTRLAVKHMQEEGTEGTVINVASMSAYLPIPVAPVYAATKAGVNQYVRSVGEFLTDKSPIRVHAVCPSFVATPLVTHNPKIVQWIEHTTGEKLISPEDIATSICTMATATHAEMPNGSSVKIYLRKGELVSKVYDFPVGFGGKPKPKL
mmetsp:Transcript_52556/g.125162  ORF Transcript_52556/g.125162 Transcript_52556/m.125162 type:complete len:267 (+) Transcript_52556:146-946(+)